jgi:tRNA 2-thiouridine synthesizing protein A
MNTEVRRMIDGRTMRYPGALMSLIGAMHEEELGSAVEVLVSDRESETDIPAWVHKAHHELIETIVDDRYTGFVVKRVA